MADDLKKVGLIFKSDGTVDFVKSLKSVNTELQTNYNNYKLVQAQWDSGVKSSEKLASKQEYLANAYDISSKKIVTLKTELEELENAENRDEEAIKKKANALTNAEAQSARYKKQLENTNAEVKAGTANLKDYAQDLEKSGESMVSAGKKMSVFSAAYIAVIGLASKAAIDFESAFAGVEKTVDGTAEQLLILKDGIRNMSKELPASTTEISAVSEAAGQLGIQTDNVLAFTKTMIDLGESTNMGAEEAAITLAKFANITKMSQLDFSRLGSVIVGLGNNFATTEKDIADMGMNLAAAGKQVGMSEPKIMALATALSSVGVEAQAGGTAFSKVMINMKLAVETGSESLTDFAKVSGLTVDEFSRMFKEDASSALQYFIDGLSAGGEKGESTIKVLDDMGISEARLRDSLMRTAGASDILRKATDLSTKAWDENIALTEEAEKRYGTTESKMKMLGNEINDLGISFGELLLPIIQKVVKAISNVIKAINNFPKPVKETILVVGGLVAAIGPLLIISGSLAGSVSKVITLYSTMKEASNGVSTASKVLGGAMTSLPFLVLAGGIAAVVAGTMLWNEHLDQMPMRKVINELDDYAEEMKELDATKKEAVESGLSEIAHYQALKFELQNLVDADGKVKEGYEARATFIMGQLNAAFGMEMEMIDGVIAKYDEQMASMDDLIAKKKAQILLDANEAGYAKAVENQEKLKKTYGDLVDDYTEYSDYMNDLEKDFLTKYDSNTGDYYTAQEAKRLAILNANDKFGEDTKTAYDKAQRELLRNTKIIDTYERAQIAMQEGNANAVLDILNEKSYDISKLHQYDNKQLQTAYDEAESLRQANLMIYEKTKDEKYLQMADQYMKEIGLINDQLKHQNDAVMTNVPIFAEAFRTQGVAGVEALASTNPAAYSSALEYAQQMVNGASDKEGAMASIAVTYGDEFVNALKTKYDPSNAAGAGMAQNSLDGAKSKNDDFSTAGAWYSQGIVGGILSKERELKGAGEKAGGWAYDSLKNILKIASPSKRTNEIGSWFGAGLVNGILSTITMVKKASNSLASTAINTIKDMDVGSEINKELTSGLLADSQMIMTAGAELLISSRQSNDSGFVEEENPIIDYNKLANAISLPLIKAVDGLSVNIDRRELGKLIREEK